MYSVYSNNKGMCMFMMMQTEDCFIMGFHVPGM